MARDFIDSLDLDIGDGTVGVIEDTKHERFYVIEVSRFETIEEAEEYAHFVIADHHAAERLSTIH